MNADLYVATATDQTGEAENEDEGGGRFNASVGLPQGV